MKDYINEVTKVSVYYENGEPFLTIEGQISGGKLTIPRIRLSHLSVKIEEGALECGNNYLTVSRKGYVEIPIEPIENEALVFYEANKPQTKEMTIREIEKKLGYNIKIKW